MQRVASRRVVFSELRLFHHYSARKFWIFIFYWCRVYPLIPAALIKLPIAVVTKPLQKPALIYSIPLASLAGCVLNVKYMRPKYTAGITPSTTNANNPAATGPQSDASLFEILQRVVFDVLIDRRVGRVGRNTALDQSVSVGLRQLDVGRANSAAGSWLVLNHNRYIP